jgi:menaquinone-dependent protoporphyrinogen oxidase
MKTAIIFATNHGTTEKVAQQIEKLLGNAQLFNLKQSKNIDLAQFDQVVIGGSVHAGTVQGSVKDFCKKNMVTLLQKRVALFLCGMNEPEFEAEFNNAFPELLRKHAHSCKVVGGEFVFEKMNFIERLIVKKVSGISQSVSKIDSEKVEELVADLQKVRTETSMLFFFV